MFCKGYTRAGHKGDKPMVIADLIAKAAPATMPTTTDNINNVSGNMALAPGSTLMTTNPFGFYTMNDEFTWDEV